MEQLKTLELLLSKILNVALCLQFVTLKMLKFYEFRFVFRFFIFAALFLSLPSLVSCLDCEPHDVAIRN